MAESGALRGAWFVIGAWDYLINEDVTTTLQVGTLRNLYRPAPQGRLGSVDFTGCELFSAKNCTYDPDRPRHVNLVDGSVWYQSGDDRTRINQGFQLDPSVSIHGRFHGSHDIKIGLQVVTDHQRTTIETPGGFVFQDRKPGARLEQGLCDPADPATHDACYRRITRPPVDMTQRGFRAGFYLQDRWWTPWEWLHVMPGIRFDYGATYASGGERVTSLFGIGPRLGLTADITGDGHNVVSAYYGRHTEPMSIGAAYQLDSSRSRVIKTEQWDPNTRDFTTLVSESGGPGGFSVDPNARMPHSDEVTLVARRAVSKGLMASTEYTYKKISNLWASVETNRIWDPTGSRVVGWVDAQNHGRSVYVYTTPSDNYTIYHGASFALNGNPTNRMRLLGFYELSWFYGPGGGYSNPRQSRFYDGFLSRDVRHRFHLLTNYNLGYVSFGAILDYQTGRNRTKVFYQQFGGGYSNRRSPNGTLPLSPNDISAVSEFRNPARLDVDLRTTIHLLPTKHRHKLKLHIDIFNLLNTRTVTGIVSSDRSNFGQVTGRQRPRNLRIGLNYEF